MNVGDESRREPHRLVAVSRYEALVAVTKSDDLLHPVAMRELEHDAADGEARVRCPMLVLWGEKGVVNRLFKPVEDWKRVADDVRGRALPCGHFLAEEAPDATLNEMLGFVGDD